MTKKITLTQSDALVVVDVQNDFLPGGALAVTFGDEIINPLNRYIEKFEKLNLVIVATRDWHPPNHISFQSQGGVWPTHCVANSFGAEFSALLNLPKSTIVISKACKQNEEAYSGFEKTHLNALLNERKIRRLFVGGLATDYCVLNTVLDALSYTFDVCLLQDAIRAVDIKPDDGKRSIEKIVQAGAHSIVFKDLD